MARIIAVALVAALLAIPGASGPTLAAKPRCDGLKATIVGTDKSQVMQGTAKADVIVAKGGSDRIFSGGGDDVICAGTGNDLIDAGSGKDRVFGGNGNDELKGGFGRDLLDGGDGLDGCYPSAGGDRVVRCEESDLSVNIIAPASVAKDAPFAFTVRVRNLGSKRSGPVELQLSQVGTAVICGVDHSGSKVLESVWPGRTSMPTTASPGAAPRSRVGSAPRHHGHGHGGQPGRRCHERHGHGADRHHLPGEPADPDPDPHADPDADTDPIAL